MLNIVTLNLIQSYTVAIALGLLTVQLYFNNSRKILNYFTYLFIFIQPILVILSNYVLYQRMDPLYAYVDICAMCGYKAEYMVNFLRIAFYSVSLAVFVPIVKNMDNWLKKNYVMFEYLYYIGFYSLSIYLYNTGPIVQSKLFSLFFWVCEIVVLISVAKNIKKYLTSLNI